MPSSARPSDMKPTMKRPLTVSAGITADMQRPEQQHRRRQHEPAVVPRP